MNKSLEFAWNAFVPPTVAISLACVYVPRIGELLDPSRALTTRFLDLLGVSVAGYFVYFVLFHTLPWLYFDWRVNRAWAASDWAGVVSAITFANRCGRDSGGWQFSLGTALSNLGEYERALAVFDGIEGPLEDPEHEFGRFLNASICLLELERPDEARSLFGSLDSKDWPVSMTLHMDEMRSRLDVEPSSRGSIH